MPPWRQMWCTSIFPDISLRAECASWGVGGGRTKKLSNLIQVCCLRSTGNTFLSMRAEDFITCDKHIANIVCFHQNIDNTKYYIAEWPTAQRIRQTSGKHFFDMPKIRYLSTWKPHVWQLTIRLSQGKYPHVR